jgi:hypothetical protein
MARQKTVDKVAVSYLALTLLPVIDPIPTGVLDVGWQVGVDDVLVDLRPTCPRQAEPTDVSLESIACREQLQTPDRQTFMGLSFVNPEWVLLLFIGLTGIDEEVAERQVERPDGRFRVGRGRHPKNRVEWLELVKNGVLRNIKKPSQRSDRERLGEEYNRTHHSAKSSRNRCFGRFRTDKQPIKDWAVSRVQLVDLGLVDP